MPTPLLSHPLVGLCSREAQIPLEHVNVHADILGAHARVMITQRYRNQEPRPIEAVYTFPLDESAAVCGFAVVIGGVRYEGAIKPREEAFAAYDDALAAGDGAFLLDEERPDVFTASIGSLAPGMEAQIELTYVTELPYEGDSIRFTLPTTVSPRYAPADDHAGIGRPPAEALNPPRVSEVPYGLSFSANVTRLGPIRRVESPSHPIAVEFNGDGATVTLAQEHAALDRDVVLLIGSEPAAPNVVLERDKTGRLAAALTFRPTFAAARVASDIVFVVDRSGSMLGSSIEQVRNALQLCLRSLQPGCNFNIVGFGSTFESLFNRCHPYGEHTLAEASRYVASLEATLGGTEILPALEFVLEQATGSERVLQVVVLTDGQVTNTDAVIEAVRRQRDRVRVFTFGIGRGASHHLVRGLARAGGGAADFVHPGERVEPKVVRLFRRALSPALTDVCLEWGGLRATNVPTGVGPVFADEPLRAYAWIDGDAVGTVTLRAVGPGGPLAWSLEIPQVDQAPGATIGTLTARTRIRELEEDGSWRPDRGSRQHERRHDRVVGDIVQLAMEYGLASRETSWVAVEKREVPLNEEAALRRVPIAITSGWGEADFVGGAPLLAMQLGSARLGPDIPDESVLRLSRASVRHEKLSPFLQRTLERLTRSRRAPGDDIGMARRAMPSTRVLDRLVALQRSDGTWDLDAALADVLGIPLGDLLAAMTGASGDADEARRAWATALALVFLAREASSHHGEWELLADKAARWLAGATAAPPGGGSWMELAVAAMLG